MKIITWIVQSLLSIAFLMAGTMKLITPYDQLVVAEGMGWANDFDPATIKLIATLEILGVIGMNLPLILKKLTFFSPVSALGLSAVMIGAIFVHAGRGELFTANIVLLVMALFVAFMRRKVVQ